MINLVLGNVWDLVDVAMDTNVPALAGPVRIGAGSAFSYKSHASASAD